METIRGRASRELDLDGLMERLAAYKYILLDLGAGDGRFVHYLAERRPDWFLIGVDTCRENLHEHSRAKAPNVLFIIASAQDLPRELNGLVSQLTINFPWGSLLESLLTADPAFVDGIRSVSRHIASLEVRLNSGALAEMGTTPEAGARRIRENLSRSGWHVGAPIEMSISSLRAFPSTWARRLAYGRDPRAMVISGFRSAGTRELP